MTSTTNLSAVRKWGTLAVCCVAALLLAVDNTVLNLAMPHLVASMKPSATQLLWIADAYGFALGGLVIAMGNLGDRVGRKRLLLIGATAFGIASALTAYAPNPELLIAARVLQGVAGATIMPSTLSLVRHTFEDPKERTLAMGIAGGIGAGGFALGPVVGGPLLNHFWWGSVFLINIPVLALVLLAGIPLLVEYRNPNPERIDWISVPLSGGGLVGLVYGIKAAARDGLAQPAVWIAIGLGALLLALFVRRQQRIPNPLLDLKLFRAPAFTGSIAANLFTIVALSAQSLAFSLYFQDVRGYDPMGTGFALLLGPAGAIISGPLTPLAIQKLGRGRTTALGLALMSVACFGYVAVGAQTDYWLLALPMLVSGAGIGFTMGVTNDTVLASAPKEKAGVAGAVGETAMELGGALGIAVLGSVLTAGYRGGLQLPAGLPSGAANAAHESLAGAVGAAGSLPEALRGGLVAQAQQAYMSGLHLTVLAGAVLLAVGVPVVARLLRGVPAVITEPEPEPTLSAV